MSLSNILASYIKALKELSKDLNKISKEIAGFKATAIKSDLNPLEREILQTILKYEARELEFRQNLIALYKKQNKPHLLNLDTAIEGKEKELQRLLRSNEQKAHEIYDQILRRKHLVRLSIQGDYFTWVSNLNFEGLKKRYLKDAKSIEASKKSLSSKILKAVALVLKRYYVLNSEGWLPLSQLKKKSHVWFEDSKYKDEYEGIWVTTNATLAKKNTGKLREIHMAKAKLVLDDGNNAFLFIRKRR